MDFDVKHIAKLAMLQFTDEEAAEFEKEFASIVGMVENLPELESEGTVTPSYPRDEMLKNAPHAVAGCIVVPKTVEQ